MEAVPTDAAVTPERERPDVEYDRAWAWTVVNTAIAGVEKSYRDRGKEDVVKDLKPFLPGSEPGLGPSDIAAKWGTPVDTVHRAIHDLRRRVREAMRREVALTVLTSAELDEELRYLVEVLSIR